MKKRAWAGLVAVAVLLGAAFVFGYQHWHGKKSSPRGEILALMPAGASAVFFADLAELRSAPFLVHLYTWAPKPQADPEYAQFLADTGFDYERDLDHIVVAFERHGQDSTLSAVADGRFDRQKITAVALQSGAVAKTGGREFFSVPVSGSTKKIIFTFLRNDRIALTVGDSFNSVLDDKNPSKEDKSEWRLRFERLAGSPVFAVLQQDAAVGAALAAQAPGGFRSPQLSTLLDQLQWITLAGKPENERLRVVAEGECAAEGTARQLADLLNGVLILVEAGLNDAKTRQQLDPAARRAYLELLKSADVSKIDRGDTKSVRVAFEITPALLEATRGVAPAMPSQTPVKPVPGKPGSSKKGHT